MPCDIKKYGKDWKEIREQILLRAGGKIRDPRIGARCEQCGVRNYAVGHRKKGVFTPARGNVFYDCYQYAVSYSYARRIANKHNIWYGDTEPKLIVIVLTTSHKDHDVNNNELSNLLALCQQCHNRHDIPMRVKHRKQISEK